MPPILESFSLQNETKINKIGDYDPFFDFFMFEFKSFIVLLEALARHEKKISKV
jgi:hypothetical protein